MKFHKENYKFADLIGKSENSSAGRAQPCQGWGRGFESHFSLFLFARMVELVDTQDLKSCGPYSPCGFKSHSGYINFQLLLYLRCPNVMNIGNNTILPQSLS